MMAIHTLWGAPAMILVVLALLYQQVGWATFVGLVVMLMYSPVSSKCGDGVRLGGWQAMPCHGVQQLLDVAGRCCRTSLQESISSCFVCSDSGWHRCTPGRLCMRARFMKACQAVLRQLAHVLLAAAVPRGGSVLCAAGGRLGADEHSWALTVARPMSSQPAISL